MPLYFWGGIERVYEGSQAPKQVKMAFTGLGFGVGLPGASRTLGRSYDNLQGLGFRVEGLRV